MLAERKRFQTSSSSTLASSSEPGGCYDELIKYASHVVRKLRRRLQRLARRVAQNHRRRRVTPERAAVAVSLRRRHRRRHVQGKTRRRTGSAHQPASLAVAAGALSSSHRSLCSPVNPHAEHGHSALRSSPEPGPSQVSLNHDSEQQNQQQQQPPQPPSPSPSPSSPPQQQQQTQPARRPDCLRMPSHDSVGYASIVSVLSWSSLPTPSANVSSSPLRKASVGVSSCVRDSEDSDSITTTRYLVLPLELITISPQSRRASSASAYMQDFCCLSSEQLVVTERHPPVSAVERVRGCVLRSESLDAAESHHPSASTAASSRHRFANRASSFAGQMPPPSPLTQQVNYVVNPPEVITRYKETPPTAPPCATDSSRSTTASPLPDSVLPPSVRRNSVNRASSLSSATTSRNNSNFLAVPDPVIGAGTRRASVIRARSLGNDDAPDIRLVTSQAPSSSAPGINHINRTAPTTTSQPSDNVARSVSPRPPVAAGDGAAALSTSFPDRSTSGGVNLLSRTNNDVDKVKVTAPTRTCVGRASSFTTADYAERARRSTRSSKLVHQTSSMLPRSPKMASDDCVYQRSPSIVPTTQQGLRSCHVSYKMRKCDSAEVRK